MTGVQRQATRHLGMHREASCAPDSALAPGLCVKGWVSYLNRGSIKTSAIAWTAGIERSWRPFFSVIVEEWVYEPDEAGDLLDSATGFHVLKATGLYAAMRGEGSGDVRLEDAVAQLREVICQELLGSRVSGKR